MNNPFQSFLPPQRDDTSTPLVPAENSRRSNYQQDETPPLGPLTLPSYSRTRSGWTAGFTEDLDRAQSKSGKVPKLDPWVINLRQLFDKDREKGLELFDKCYDLYRRSFTDPNQVEPQTNLLRALVRTRNPCHMIAMVQDGEVLGVRHSSIISTSCPELGTCAFDEYIYVDPSVRKGGLGKALLEKTDRILSSWGVRFAFAEINDPHVMTQELVRKDLESGISPEQRLLFWKKCGYEGVDAPYLQPPVSEGMEAVFHLRIALKQLSGNSATSLPSSSLAALLRAFHSTFVPDGSTHELARRLYKELETIRPERTAIIPIDTPRSCLGTWRPSLHDDGFDYPEEQSFGL